MHYHSDYLIVTRCPDCNIQFSSAKAFQLHYDEQHKKIKLEPDLQNSQPTSLFHKRTRRPKVELFDAKALICKHCSFATKTEYLLQKHIQTQHNPHRTVYSCHLCNYFCLQERTFNLHRLKHSELAAKFACDQCGKLFLSMGIMKRHSLTHNKSKPFICDMAGCGIRFNIKSRLTDHKRYVHKISSECSQYEKNVNNAASVSNCYKSTMSKSNKCSIDSKFLEMKGKISHRRIVGEDLASCNFIPKKNTTSYSCAKDDDAFLPSMSQSRNGCEVKNCSDSNSITIYDVILFDTDGADVANSNDCLGNCKPNSLSDNTINPSVTSKKCLKINAYSINSKKNPSNFTCSWTGCGKTFRDGFNLRMHTCTHTGEMQRACKLCGYTCVQKSALDRHMKVHQRSSNIK